MTKEQLLKEVEGVLLDYIRDTLKEGDKKPLIRRAIRRTIIDRLENLIHSHYIPKSEVVEMLKRLRKEAYGVISNSGQYQKEHNEFAEELNTKITKEISKLK